MAVRLSICIPAYNRPLELVENLESIAIQNPQDCEIVVSEDKSPKAAEIEAAVAAFAARYPAIPVRYFANPVNLGYDGNLRSLLDKATGDYCMFAGDDDLFTANSIARIQQAITRPNVGVVLRAWMSVDKATGAVIEMNRYFFGDRVFDAGVNTVAAFFRRSIFISGLTFHRTSAQKVGTDRFDGRLLYQLYLVGKLLEHLDGVYVDEVVALRRCGGEHFFGTASSEQGRFAPKVLHPDHSVNFVAGLTEIARFLDAGNPGVLPAILRQLGRYSYPMLEIQAAQLGRLAFHRYARQLAALGYGREPLFWGYYAGLMVLGVPLCNATIRGLKRLLGRTPNFGGESGQSTSLSD